MTDDNVSVSVVIPAWNAAVTLSEQLEALSAQVTALDGEVIVADNGSTDGTAAVARRWADRIPRLRVVDAAARRGPAAARNIGAAAARGRLLVFCDADDVVASEWLALMISGLEEHDLVGGLLETRSLRRPGAVTVSWEPTAEIHLHYWTRFEATPSSNLGIRRVAFDALGGFDEALVTGEDVDLCWRAQVAGFSFGRVPGAVVRSRPRVGLRAIYRQAFSYGKGHRQLRKKYAEHIAAHVEAAAERSSGAMDTARPEATSPRRSTGARVRRLLTPSGRADLTWRVGQSLGEHLSRADRHIGTLPRDDD